LEVAAVVVIHTETDERLAAAGPRLRQRNGIRIDAAPVVAYFLVRCFRSATSTDVGPLPPAFV
jgi:hypothetical protein